MIDLFNYPLVAILCTGLVIILAATEFGRRLGMNANRKVEDDISTLEAAMLGLLALIIGFTFAMALSRFDTRRDAVLLEANAIGTTALRARLLPEPHRKEVLKLLRDYVRVRLDITQRTPSLADLETAIKQSNDIQEALWREAMAISAIDQNMVPTGLFIQTLNEMIDDQAKRLAALRSRIPNIVLLALFGIAAVVCGFAGYTRGLEFRRDATPVYILGFLVTVVIILILDLDRPNAGFIQTSPSNRCLIQRRRWLLSRTEYLDRVARGQRCMCTPTGIGAPVSSSDCRFQTSVRVCRRRP